MPSSSRDAQRIEHLDALRGFALFGILIVNIGVFASPWFGLGAADPAFDAPSDRITHGLIAALFEMKFYLLFSFLFGYSFQLQLDSARRADAAFVPRMVRRLLGLWSIGLIHAVLLFHGDILSTYAVLGLLLLAMRDSPEQLAWRRAIRLIGMTAAAWAGLALLLWIGGDTRPADADAAALARAAQAVQSGFTGDPGEVIDARLHELGSTAIVLACLQAPCALAMFLFGLIAGRRQVLARLDRYQPLLRRVRWYGLSIGLPAALVFAAITVLAPGGPLELLALALSVLTAPWLSLAYAAWAMAAFDSAHGRRAVAALAPAGRMALSNYLLQSLACALVFTGYGFGLMGRVSPLGCVAIAVALFGAQLWLSRWWLRRHAYGPVEWLLRALTIGHWPRLRKGLPDSR
ncbi:DUF418 domain-containing protein [Lysobacter sp. Root690]|uniref:DUF418 domain-containing protein n=1 Tax=Lysobacter sp. Root690 TaxID=1736588 RepID=UPI0006FE1527|nr:DUF418 domain-containing protein [Lysobacter sp. Root690]KRB11358.1 hypothetical protein ASD86_02745 [Lysobacter sp. Root690]